MYTKLVVATLKYHLYNAVMMIRYKNLVVGSFSCDQKLKEMTYEKIIVFVPYHNFSTMLPYCIKLLDKHFLLVGFNCSVHWTKYFFAETALKIKLQ